ncbi:general secretion pathway protein GspI [Vibrio parahaemolyticus]|nr:general secretion pathway protein GspI [Vibrio parahaemolyticus]
MMRSLLYCVPAPLNAALVVNEENAAKAECLELKSVCFWWRFVLQF